ncbi:50S ribosomal protein L4 [Alphaproteobacteria bacterium]|nr:50S ribosomal protein L4 [Alphaproteobacteria bacterium]GHS96648.1 50S ribosomal protein L4 [Alphaproteobacteria bacterium]
MKVEVINVQYQSQGTAELNDELFGLEPRADILSRVVRWQLAKRRSGTHQTRTISMVSGTGKKSVRQKGSGGARHGSRRGTQFRGGGIVFGPTPRDYGYALQKKVRKLGLRMAIADKIRSGEVLVLTDLNLDSPKTKPFLAPFLEKGVVSALLVDDVVGDNARNAVQNSREFDILPQIGLNVYDVLQRDYLLLTRSAVESLEKRLK